MIAPPATPHRPPPAPDTVRGLCQWPLLQDISEMSSSDIDPDSPQRASEASEGFSGKNVSFG
jgi:hypothetical protein